MPDNILPYAKFSKIYERKDLEPHIQIKVALREHVKSEL